MPGPFALDFLIFVFIASFGVLQVVFARSSLRGLLLFKSRQIAFMLGLLLITAAFLWFFLSEPRNLSDTQGGLDGNQAAGLFSVGAGLALVLTLGLTSLRNRSMGDGGHRMLPGLEALKETTYFKALFATLRVLWKRS